MYDDQSPLFGATSEEDPATVPGSSKTPVEKIQSVAEVFELARRHFGLASTERDGEDEDLPPALAKARSRRLDKAREIGLVAKWASYKQAKGHVSIHDPGSGGWHDLLWKDAPGWAQREALKRSSIYRTTGDARAFEFTAKQMHEIWEEERPPEEGEDGIIEEYELPDD